MIVGIIITFEKETFELSPYEKYILMPEIENLFKTSPKGTVINNHKIREHLKMNGLTCTAPTRIRKLIHIIRCTDEVPMLIATNNGYMVAETDAQMEIYIQSLEERIERICITKNSMKRQLANKTKQQDLWTG